MTGLQNLPGSLGSDSAARWPPPAHALLLPSRHVSVVGEKKETGGTGGMGVLLGGCSLLLFLFCVVFCRNLLPKAACHGVVVVRGWRLAELPHCVQTQQVSYCEMAIKGEVHVRNLLCHPAATSIVGAM